MSAAVQPVIDIPYVEHMLRANPRDAGAWSTLGVLLRRAGKPEAAIACHHRALQTDPAFGAVWSNLGNVLTDLGCHEQALAAHQRALTLGPETPSAAFNYIVGLRKQGDFARTLSVIEHALRLEPGNPTILWERSLTRLQMGDYPLGFADYEARRGIPNYRNRVPEGQHWDGGPLEGRTILLSTEQGFGDALLAARYVPLVKARGARVLFECHNELRRVLAGLEGVVDEFVPAGASYPPYHLHASQMSLPRLFGTTIDTVPPPVTLAVPEDARAKAARLVPGGDRTLRVGIVWSGRVTFADNLRRATGLSRFLRFLGVPGVELYSLQKGPPEEQLANLGTGLLITPLGPELNDFAETAAVVERLDLVLMTDSSVAHLAGSLGRPVWNLVQYMPYWIYGYQGEGTPWYPSMRLFRQGPDEDWEPVFERARRELAILAARKAAG
jgi:tetratricopeptide (TPR) repeat protein